MPRTNALIEAAYEYLRLGMRVIALTGKAPNGRVHPHGLNDALSSDDTDRTILWAFCHQMTTGVGILTGSGRYVVDIDGPEGAAAWRELVGADDFIPDRWVAKTGRGYHLWVAYWSSETFSTTKLAEKLDFKGNGGYVAAPPSRHPDGHYYRWELPPGDEPLREMPEQLLALLRRRQADAIAKQLDKRTMKAFAPSSYHDGKFYPVATFDGIIERVREEAEGNRNAVLYWAARTMLEEGSDEEDLEGLFDAAVTSGLARREARRTIRSAIGAVGE